MTMKKTEKIVGKIIRIEWNEVTGELHAILEITDEEFKSKLIHSKNLEDIIFFNNKDVVMG